MKIFGVVGWSGSGKTTLITQLLPWLRSHGLSVSTIKHARHNFDLDQPGKDTFANCGAGAREVLISSSSRWALLHENRGATEPSLEDLVALMTPVDFVVVEGFKRHAHPRLEVHRPSIGRPLICSEEPGIVAVASDKKLSGCSIPVLDLNDVDAIANFIVRHCELKLA
jgi:molybdopterin-guanine dinucleotide biosynthesis adapter protein